MENIKLWNGGLRYQLHSSEYSLKCTDLNEDICFKINKADLEKNKNNVIYQKNGSVLSIDKISKIHDDYIVYFTTEGYYQNDYGFLISAVKYTILPSGELYYDINAKCFMDNTECMNYSFSDLNSKKGNEFSFVIPSAIFDKTDVDTIILKDLVILEFINNELKDYI